MYLRICFVLLIFLAGRSSAIAQYEKVSSLRDGSLNDEYLSVSEAIQVFTVNAPYIHKLAFHTFSEGELQISFYSAENSFGQFKFIDENNHIYSRKIRARAQALTELYLPDTLIFNVGRKYFIRISSNTPFLIFIKDNSINGEQLYLDNEFLPDKTLDFELHTGYGRKRKANSFFQTSALFWKDGFMNSKTDSTRIQSAGVVFKADVAFLKSLILDLSISALAEGYAEICEFDVKNKKPVYYAKAAYPIRITYDTSGRILLDWEKQKLALPFLNVGKYYFLSWKFKDECMFVFREKRTPITFRYIPNDLSVSCTVEGYDYFFDNVKESVEHPFIERDTVTLFKYKPSVAYNSTFVIRNPSGNKGFLNVYKEDTAGRILIYRLNFNNQSKGKEIQIRSLYTLSFEVAGKYLIELDYDTVNIAGRKESTMLELYGCNKYNDGLSKINATKLQEPFARNILHRLKVLSAHDFNWLCIDIPEKKTNRFLSAMNMVMPQAEQCRMGIIMNICLDERDSIADEAYLNFLEYFARKNISKKIIFNFYSRANDLQSYEAFLLRLKMAAGRLRTIESNFVLGETIHDSLLSNVSWQSLFRKHVVPVQLFTFSDSYDVQKALLLRDLALEMYSHIDGTIQPRVLLDYSAIKEYSLYGKNSFNKVFDNYRQENLSHLTGRVFNIPVYLRQCPERELSEMIVKLKAAIWTPLDKSMSVKISIIQNDTLIKVFSLDKIDKDSIIRLRFALPSGFMFGEKLVLNAEFGKEITLYGIEENTDIEVKSPLLIPCLSLGVRSKGTDFKQGELQPVKGSEIGQTFTCEKETIQGLVFYCDQIYKRDIALSLYEFVSTELPKGKPLIEGLLPRNDIEIEHCNYYNINLPDCKAGKKYYFEFTRNGGEITAYKSISSKSQEAGLAYHVIYSYLDEIGTFNLPSRNDDSLNVGLYYSEIFNTKLIQNIILQQSIAGLAGYVLSRDVTGVDSWHEKDHYGLMVQSFSEDSIIRNKKYLSKFYDLNVFSEDCEVSPYPSPVRLDKKDYGQTVFYHPENREIRIVIRNKQNLTPFEIEDVLNLQWTLPENVQSINLKYENKQITTFNNSADVLMRGEPLFIVLKLKDEYLPE